MPIQEWSDYYREFEKYFVRDLIRDGCQPRIGEHANATDSVILVHGLTDSPHFLTAIAEHFHDVLGYNVYLPLLHCHGLKNPRGMEEVELEEWKANVRFAIRIAGARTERVSIGGLSTGGALSLYMACTKQQLTGDLYLFSAALDLAGGPIGLWGEMKKWIVGSFLADVLDSNEPLIGRNPYRYCRMDLDGARELVRLIKEIDDLLDGYDEKRPFPRRVFAAHSEADTTAAINGIERLQEKCQEGSFHFHRIPKASRVSHASLVLKDAIIDGGEELEKANPGFPTMISELSAFANER